MGWRNYDRGLVMGALIGVILSAVIGYASFKAGYYTRFEEDNAEGRALIERNARLNWKRNHQTTQSQPTTRAPDSELQRMADEELRKANEAAERDAMR